MENMYCNSMIINDEIHTPNTKTPKGVDSSLSDTAIQQRRSSPSFLVKGRVYTKQQDTQNGGGTVEL